MKKLFNKIKYQTEEKLMIILLEYIHNWLASHYYKIDLYNIFKIIWEIYQFMTYDLSFEFKTEDIERQIIAQNGTFEF